MLQLDHIFVLASPNAPEADRLTEAGLIEGTSREHPGQGTSNRRFFFANTTLEFLYIHNIAEAINGAGSKLKLVERAINAEGSPFGLVTRWFGDEPTPDYPYWEYQPDYFPAPMCFYVGKNSDNFDEPLCICMPPALPPPSTPPEPNNALMNLTAVELSIPHYAASETLTRFGECDLMTIALAEEHKLKLVFNDAAMGRSINLMPDIPLVVIW